MGGCDKIRPLIRHYISNTDALVGVIDASDRARLYSDGKPNGSFSTVQGVFATMLHEDELRNAALLIYLNKSDLANIMTVAEVRQCLELDGNQHKHRKIHVQACCATSGEGVREGLDWLAHALKHPEGVPSPPLPPPCAPPTSEDRKPDVLEEWLSRIDEPDEVFLAQLEACTLQCWDHYTHLRIAYLMLNKHERNVALPMIFSSLKQFIATSSYLNHPSRRLEGVASKRTTFHETMSYFWVHMVHYALISTKLPKQDFHTFLLLNPQLSDSGLFLHYYSQQRMLQTAGARTEVLLPDLRPLPSIVASSLDRNKRQPQCAPIVPVASIAWSDEAFYEKYLQQSLPAWGHLPKLRLMYVFLLAVHGRRRGGSDRILEALKQLEGAAHFHLTSSYFWLHILTQTVLRVSTQQPSPGPCCVYGKLLSEELGLLDDAVWRADFQSFETFLQLTGSRTLSVETDLRDPMLIYQ